MTDSSWPTPASLVEVAVSLTENLDQARVLGAVAERCGELTNTRWVVACSTGEDERVVGAAGWGLEAEDIGAALEDSGLLRRALDTERAVFLEPDDVAAATALTTLSVESGEVAGVPMRTRGNLVGALFLGMPAGESFSADLREIVVVLASIAAVAVENSRLFAAESARAERSAVLQEIASKVRRSLELSDILSTTVESLGVTAGVDRCFIRLVREEGEASLGPIDHEWDAEGLDPAEREAQFPVSSLAARTRATQWSDDVTEDERLRDPTLEGTPEDLLRNHARSALAAPLLWGDELLGIIAFHRRSAERWTEAEIAMIEAAAREVAVAVHHAQLYSRALEVASDLQELDQVRSEFISMVSHEVRTPMTVVAGIADILQNRADRLSPETRAELTETLGREARRLTRLVTEVLDLEAMDRTGMKLSKEPVDLARLAAESVADAGQGARSKIGVDGGNATVRADRDKVKQVFINLLSNAAKFSPEGAAIQVRVSPQASSVVVGVRDEGPGISEDEMAQLFQPFSRLPTGETKPGSGIGLYLCRSIVARHGGKIWVESEPDQGSEFIFELPR